MSEEMTDEKKRETEGELPAEETNGSGNDAETVRCEKNDGEKTDGEKAEGKKCAGPDGEKGEKCEKKKKLFAELETAKKEAEENKRKWYAVTAEYENYRRRTEKQSAQRYADGRNDVIAALFPVGDNLERALSSCADEQTKKGLEMVLKSFEKLLADEGIETIFPVGQPFSADEAEAIMAVPAEEGEVSGTVKQVYLKGYRKSGKVLRYAQVVVIS
ncbi:MAG: nucleotide exchange factor GrpE [Candidatus Borkfalkiaceae bacterium]|nr:nucleotide exchange factor GrpE [Clostridia bacterium]MDY6222975.1 nucleotide exchange factor GrpE [Christensenellaceae bacterium]